MSILAVFALILGIILGIWYNIVALVPPIIIALVFTITEDIIDQRDLSSSALFLFLTVACLQLGYLFGSMTRSLSPRSLESHRGSTAERISASGAEECSVTGRCREGPRRDDRPVELTGVDRPGGRRFQIARNVRCPRLRRWYR